ncbi:MAG TPA: lipopolysaccharide heptosyltransferase II [Tepidisphaeraceae bacterium]|jgi:heptosyltransferase-2
MSDPQRILVVQPSWVGDAAMATPALRAIRHRFPNAQISYLIKRYVKPMYTGMPWADRLITYRTGRTRKKAGRSKFFGLAAKLRLRRFDMAILLPGSFKAALICRMARIPRVVGYDRDGRGFLLTDKLLPAKENGRYIPSPIIKYYLGLASYLGSPERDLTMSLFVTDAERREADAVLARANVPEKRPWILLNPGANYGASKCWPAEYYADLANRLVEAYGATILISSAPKERKIVDEIYQHLTVPAVDLAKAGMSLGALKEIVRRCDLMVTNDTGPRHIAAAFDVPVVSIFGPTHPEWTDIYYAKERICQIKVHCGPCQLKTCPLDHRCMTRLTPSLVMTAVDELLRPVATI